MRILFIAHASSPIAARWISQLADTGWDIHVYSTTSDIHPMIRQYNKRAVIYTLDPIDAIVLRIVAIWPFPRGVTRLKKFLTRLARSFVPTPEQYIVNLIEKLQPDCIHSLKMHPEGYYMSQANKLLNHSLPGRWIHSVWGGDIYPHQNSRRELERITEALANCDYLLAGSARDIDLARKYGFSGHDFGVIPSGGGWDICSMRTLIEVEKPSQRKIIAVKGYHSEQPGGKALTALKALELCGRTIEGYKVIVHSAIGTYASSYLTQVRAAADKVSQLCNVEIEFLPYGPPEAIWKLFGKSRIALAINDSDGIPNAMLEAMIMGAYAIQSDTGGLNVWIEQGAGNGSLVPYDNPQAIADAILLALSNDQLVDSAAEMNYTLTKSRIDRATLREKAIQVYQEVSKLSSEQRESSR